METSRISTVIENYFRQLLTFQTFFEKETEIRRSCKIDEQWLTIELIDVDFVSTTGLKGSGLRFSRAAPDWNGALVRTPDSCENIQNEVNLYKMVLCVHQR